jgi:hypothetical protein
MSLFRARITPADALSTNLSLRINSTKTILEDLFFRLLKLLLKGGLQLGIFFKMQYLHFIIDNIATWKYRLNIVDILI